MDRRSTASCWEAILPNNPSFLEAVAYDFDMKSTYRFLLRTGASLMTATLLAFPAMAIADPNNATVDAHPCVNVLDQARVAATPQLRLERLGGCLAAPYQLEVHRQVVVEMALTSLQLGELKDTQRYLEILRMMTEPEQGF